MVDPATRGGANKDHANFDDLDEETTKVGIPSGRGLDTRRNRPCLIVLAGENVGEMIRLASSSLILGRSSEAHVRIQDDDISRRHARLFELDGKMRIEDLGSANGTRVNGEPVTSRTLVDGDKIELGSATVLKFTYHDELDEQFQQTMYDAAQRDGLTKVFNKRYFFERLGAEFAYAKRHATSLSLLMVDADHFKRVNDVHGHIAGDYVLARLASVIATTVRTEDVVARYGGEEFAVICRGIEPTSAAKLGERLRRLVEATEFAYEGTRLHTTVCVGVGGFPHASVASSTDLILAADEGLYDAKRGGRNRVVVWSRQGK
jgi:two-component system, cell cycle response regulator